MKDAVAAQLPTLVLSLDGALRVNVTAPLYACVSARLRPLHFSNLTPSQREDSGHFEIKRCDGAARCSSLSDRALFSPLNPHLVRTFRSESSETWEVRCPRGPLLTWKATRTEAPSRRRRRRRRRSWNWMKLPSLLLVKVCSE